MMILLRVTRRPLRTMPIKVNKVMKKEKMRKKETKVES